MGLADRQRTLARLYTDRDLRERFFADPSTVGQALGLSPDDSREVASVSSPEVALFARSLIAKRCQEVGKLLPLTRRTMARRFDACFTRFAAVPIPGGIHKHHADALAFARFLLSDATTDLSDPPWLRDLLRYEQTWLQMALPGARLLIRGFRHPVGRLMRLFAERETAPWLPASPSVGLWIRFPRSGTVRHRFVTLPQAPGAVEGAPCVYDEKAP